MSAGSSSERTARILTISGVITIVAGVVLGAVVEPVLFVIVLVGVVDVVIARVIASGRLGGGSVGSAASDSDETAAPNPYARED